MKNKWIIILALAVMCGMARASITIAAYEVYHEETYTHAVRLEWNGSLDFTGAENLHLSGPNGFIGNMTPSIGSFELLGYWYMDYYSLTNAPDDFGPGGLANANSGAIFGVDANGAFKIDTQNMFVAVDLYYESGTPVYGWTEFYQHTLESIGLNEGTYVWTVAGSNDTITMNVNAIPEPASALLIGCGAALIAVVRRFYGRA